MKIRFWGARGGIWALQHLKKHWNYCLFLGASAAGPRSCEVDENLRNSCSSIIFFDFPWILMEIMIFCVFSHPQPFTKRLFSLGRSKGWGAWHSRELENPKTDWYFRDSWTFTGFWGIALKIKNKGNNVMGCPGANMSAATLEKHGNYMCFCMHALYDGLLINPVENSWKSWDSVTMEEFHENRTSWSSLIYWIPQAFTKPLYSLLTIKVSADSTPNTLKIIKFYNFP